MLINPSGSWKRVCTHIWSMFEVGSSVKKNHWSSSAVSEPVKYKFHMKPAVVPSIERSFVPRFRLFFSFSFFWCHCVDWMGNFKTTHHYCKWFRFSLPFKVPIISGSIFVFLVASHIHTVIRGRIGGWSRGISTLILFCLFPATAHIIFPAMVIIQRYNQIWWFYYRFPNCLPAWRSRAPHSILCLKQFVR